MAHACVTAMAAAHFTLTSVMSCLAVITHLSQGDAVRGYEDVEEEEGAL